MKHTLYMSVLVLATLCAVPVMADPGCAKGGWAHDGPYWRLVNPREQITINGEIQAIEHMPPVSGMTQGVHLKVATPHEVLEVHLGPAWYVDNQEPTLKVKDKVEIVGSKVLMRGRPAIIAFEIRHEGQVLRLRDDSGRPLWCGWRRL